MCANIHLHHVATEPIGNPQRLPVIGVLDHIRSIDRLIVGVIGVGTRMLIT